MEWKTSGIPSIEVGGRYIPVQSLWLKDTWGYRKYYRIKTVLDLKSGKPSSSFCWSQLARDNNDRIGALVMGAHRSGWLKVGSSGKFLPYLFVALDALPRKIRKKLLIPLDYELLEEEDAILAKEKAACPYYVGSKRSNLFHEPGCWQAKRIKETYKLVFASKKEALGSGYTAHRACGG